MRTEEQKLWDTMRRRAPDWVWMQRVENGVGDGMPDVYVVADHGTQAWVELKTATIPRRDTTALLGSKGGLRQSQINWHVKATQMGVRTFILIRDDQGTLYLIPGCLAEKVNKMTIEALERATIADHWESVFAEVTA